MQNLNHVERFLSCLDSGMANGNNKNMGLHCGFSFQVKHWKTQGRFFFPFFCSTRNTNPILNAKPE